MISFLSTCLLVAQLLVTTSAYYIGKFVHDGHDFTMAYEPAFTSTPYPLHEPSNTYTVDFTGSFEGVRHWYERIRGLYQAAHIKDDDLTVLSLVNSDILFAKFEGRELKFTRQPDSSPSDAQYIGEYVHVGDDFIMSYALRIDGKVKFSFKVPGQPTFTSVSHSLHGPSHVYTVDFTGSFEGVRYCFVNGYILFAKFEGQELKFTRRSDRVPFDAQYIGRFVYDGDDFTMASSWTTRAEPNSRPNAYAIDFTGSFEGVRHWYKRIRGIHQGVDIKDGDLTSLILTNGGIVATFDGLEFRFTRRPYPRANLRK
ncbi:hypothetical protein FOL46_006742 [Perkinsus olseni]|uniref:Uncharacterized protein n=1 Tax=Perkinsus olseni TaxID=32597 RepID=A0A7J6LIB9_PEROL|nr:hypothetical protein FOL46_006742 [Perkinsus olseni]